MKISKIISPWIALVTTIFPLYGCSYMELTENINRPFSSAIVNHETTPLGIKVKKLTAVNNGQKSGFIPLDGGEEALLWRGLLADRATRTIDAQYFIWSQDNIGTIAAERLIQAANRGVQVRVIVDELTIDAKPEFLTLLDGHPNVEIRLYNPSGSLGIGGFGKIFRILGDFQRLNRRMHNKAFIVDGSFAIIGGRNIADEYFDLDARLNFRDLDMLAIGPVVPEISKSFDDYWNSKWVIPVEEIIKYEHLPENQKYFQDLHKYASQETNFQSRFNQELEILSKMFDSISSSVFNWGVARLIYDAPGKNLEINRLDGFGESGKQLTDLALGARNKIIVETPYLVLLDGTFNVLESLRKRGVEMTFITNSLAATDAIWVHASYAFQRRKLLGMGINLFEYRPDPDDRKYFIDNYQIKNENMVVSIHAKTMVIDDKSVFIGSFNMDPRSTHLNTEMGLIIDSPDLASNITRRLKIDMAPQNSWRVTLTEEGRMQWVTQRSGRPVIEDSEPDVSLGKGLLFLPLAILPITPLM